MSAVSDKSKAPFDLGLITRFLIFLRPYQRQVWIGAATIPFSIAFSVLFPWLIMHVIDTSVVQGQSDGLLWWCVLLLLVLAGNYISDALFSYLLQKAALQGITDMRADMFARVLCFRREYFDRTPVGVTLTRLTSDLEAVNDSFAQGLLSMVRDILTTVALLVFLFFINWQLALMVLLLGPPTYLLTEALRRRLRESYARGRSVLSRGTGYLQECLNGMKTVQLYSAEDVVQEKYRGFTRGFFRAQSQSNFYDAALFSVIEGITTIAMALIIWFGAWQMLSASLTFGVLIGFTQTLDRIFVPIRDFTSQIASIQRALAAFTHMEELFLQPLQEDPVSVRSQVPSGEPFQSLEFDNVSFRYQAEAPLVLNGVSFFLKRGQKLALVGSTGSGKSTILRLLTKTYENYQGSIRLNGRELREMSQAEVCAFFNLMQQEVYLFNQSIGFNIALDRPELTQRDIEAAAEYVYADGFIKRLPGQYEFQVKGNGSNLSSGQGQLIAFARVIASGADVVLLDEATASIDSVTEKLIQKAIDHVFSEKTVIAIAHRLSTIEHSDVILVMDQGKVVERGSHEQLMGARGYYYQLTRSHEELT